VIAGTFSTWLVGLFNAANWGVTSLLLAFVQWAATLPGAYLSLPPSWLRPPAQLTVFDLGTGGAQVLITRNEAWLFDSGSARDTAAVIEPALRAAGVRRSDALVVTHGDAEHTGGATELTTLFQPRAIFDSALGDRSAARRAFHRSLREQEKPKRLVFAGDRTSAGDDTAIIFLYPDAGKPGRTADDQCIVVRIDHGPFRVLLMSDSGAETEAALLRGDRDALRADVLVLGRHAQDIVATAGFLAAVQPRVVILAAPDPFRDGSDEPALRRRLAASGAEIFDQEQTGAVILTVRRSNLAIRGYLDKRVSIVEAR
ncbi:MAG: ComEC/Rec2 family competence protein, partial [Chthoniobacterales bacterium]